MQNTPHESSNTLQWEDAWAQEAAEFLAARQVCVEVARASGTDSAELAHVDEQLGDHIRAGFDQPRERFQSALDRLSATLAETDQLDAYAAFSESLHNAAQTFHWLAEETAEAGATTHTVGRSSLFGFSVLVLSDAPELRRIWSVAASERLAAVLARHGQVSSCGRTVVLPVALNGTQAADFEPWMGYRLTAALQQWALDHPSGQPSVAAAQTMLEHAGLAQLADAVPPMKGSTSARFMRPLTLVGLHIPAGEDPMCEALGGVSRQDQLDYDFPQANFSAHVRALERDLEDVILALALRQGTAMVAQSAEEVESVRARFEAWPLAELQQEATEISADLDALREQHPSLAQALTAPGPFGESRLAQQLAAVLADELLPSGGELQVEPAFPATFLSEAVHEGLVMTRHMRFTTQALALATQLGLASAAGMGAHVDVDAAHHRLLVTVYGWKGDEAPAAGGLLWPVLSWENLNDGAAELTATLRQLGTGPHTVRGNTAAPHKLH
jgi:hypothetical protein